MAGKNLIEIEAGGVLKLPPAIQRSMRAPVGTKFAVVSPGEHLLLVFREDEEQPQMLEWAESAAMVGMVGSFGIADLFGALNMGQKTGVVVFVHESNHKEVYFERGEIVFAVSNQADHRLGEILVKRGQLTDKQLKEILANKSRNVRLGSQLIQQGLLKAKDLYEAVRYQVEEIIYSIFPMESGVFYFFEGDFLDEDLSQFTLNTQSILMEGYRRLDEWGMMREKIPHQDVIIMAKEGAAPAKFETPSSEKIYGLIDGRKSVKKLMRESGMGDFDVTRALYDLLKRGAIEAVDPKAAAAEKGKTLDGMIESYNRLYIAVLKALRQAGQGEIVSPEQVSEFVEGLDERMRTLMEEIRFDAEQALAGQEETLLANLEREVKSSRAGSTKVAGLDALFKRQQLQTLLDELLNYLLFASKNALPPKQADPFIQKVRAAHKRIRGS